MNGRKRPKRRPESTGRNASASAEKPCCLVQVQPLACLVAHEDIVNMPILAGLGLNRRYLVIPN